MTGAPAASSHSAAHLYVDLDGVLHHEAVQWHPTRGIHMDQTRAPGRTLFEWSPILIDVLASFPSVRLVLSSTWCIRPRYANTLMRLPAVLRARFVGGTFNKGRHRLESWGEAAFRDKPRWMQISHDVQRRGVTNWIAIDDDVDDWPADLHSNLVACDGDSGLSATAVQAQLRQRLRNLCCSLREPPTQRTNQ